MLSAEPGVERAVVNLVTETAAIQYTGDAVSAMQLATAAAEKVQQISCLHPRVTLIALTLIYIADTDRWAHGVILWILR